MSETVKQSREIVAGRGQGALLKAPVPERMAATLSYVLGLGGSVEGFRLLVNVATAAVAGPTLGPLRIQLDSSQM